MGPMPAKQMRKGVGGLLESLQQGSERVPSP